MSQFNFKSEAGILICDYVESLYERLKLCVTYTDAKYYIDNLLISDVLVDLNYEGSEDDFYPSCFKNNSEVVMNLIKSEFSKYFSPDTDEDPTNE